MSAYLDASILVALFTHDAMTPRATALVGQAPKPLVVSDFAALEVASSVSRMVRIKALKAKDATLTVADFDAWMLRHAAFVQIEAADISAATAYIRRLDLNLRAPDAIHLATAGRLGATLVTVDAKLKACAKEVGVPTA